ncbi:MAG: phosphonopyruvate decarboxylase [Hyphomicrobiales bacterium]|nr:phosphonopyruvate decarboxylase [Hyphomicrobiales bacterium]
MEFVSRTEGAVVALKVKGVRERVARARKAEGGQHKTLAGEAREWPLAVYHALREAGVGHMAFVPDAGHSELIQLFDADKNVTSNVLTTEEEGIAIASGAWLGGVRSVILMQSSGVGNCINMLSLATISRFPLLMLVTMRGEWAEFNPWQVPMGRATEPALNAIGVRTMRAEAPEALIEIVGSAATLAYEADQQIAVLISQRMLGRKKW